jgi:hypothetical protein
MAMESSPPTRPWHRANSDAGSQYSLDLGALDLDSDDEPSLPKQKVERIFSEDIEGPSDFTLNMEKWMRGGTLRNGTTRSAKSAMQSLKEAHEAEQKMRADSTRKSLQVPQSPHKEGALSEGEPTMSHHTPMHSPPRESVWDERRREQDEDNITSDWNPYAEASHGGTPQPPAHKQFLQPTVEDYYSELTPARHPSAMKSPHSPDHVATPTEAHISPTKDKSSSPARASSPTLSPVRSPVMQRETSSQPSSGQDLQSQLQQLQAKCRQLEHLNSALKQALDEEQRIRKQEKAVHEMHVAEAARHDRDMHEMKQEAYKRADDFRAEYAEQKERMHKMEGELASTKQEAERWNSHHKEEIELLREEIENQQSVHGREMQAIRQELATARRARDDAEGATRVHREELEETRDAYEAEVDRLRSEVRKAEEARTTIAELNAELEAARKELAKVRDAKTKAEDDAAELRDELLIAQRNRDQETTRLTMDHRRAVEMAEKLQQQLKQLQQELRDQRSTHENELTRLKSTHDQAQAATTAEMTGLRDQLDADGNQSELNDAIIERDEAHDNLSALRTSHDELQTAHQTLQSQFSALQIEHTSMKSKLEDVEAVNAAMEARISDALRRRETYWRERLEESEKERKLMAKALLHQWGREEVGVASPQPYEYKYVARRNGVSPTKAGAA